MKHRYKVKPRISVEVDADKNGLKRSPAPASGFNIYDKQEKKTLPEFYLSPVDAEEACERLNVESLLLDLTDSTRGFFHELRALSTNDFNQEIFVGLTREESKRYLFLSHRLSLATTAELEEYVSLDERYNGLRLQVIDAEHQIQTKKPSFH